MPRLFVAARVAVNDALAALLRELGAIRGVKAVEPENIHYTLRFIGEVFDTVADLIRDSFPGIHLDVPAFDVHIRGLGAFPKPEKPRVVWAGCDEESKPRFRALAAAVDRFVEERTVGARDPERARATDTAEGRKAFVPHLTLARVKSLEGRGGAAIKEILEQNADNGFATQRIDRIHLVESKLTAKGSVYTDIAEAPLA